MCGFDTAAGDPCLYDILDMGKEYKVRTNRVIVTATHQTDENATAPREAERFLYLVSAIYHYVHFIVHSCAILDRV